MVSRTPQFPFLISTLSLCAVLVPLAAAKPHNSTLIYHNNNNNNSVRNCSCASRVEDCNKAQANMLCSCRTVPLSSITGSTGFTYQGGLTVWLKDPWVLRLLVNYSSVPDLRLAACGANPLPPEYLTVFGLKRLRIYNSAVGVEFPEQGLSIEGLEKARGKQRPLPQETPHISFMVSFLDLALLNGDSSLKAYSVKHLPSIGGYFPNLLFPSPFEPVDSQYCLVTLIY